MLSAILLAAGSSTRMAPANKLLLPWQDRTILYYTAAQLLNAGIEELIVVTGHDPDAIKNTLHPLPVQFTHNTLYTQGLTSSIHAGIRAAHGDGFMICLADMVLITTPEYTLLKKEFEFRYAIDNQCILLPDYQGRSGNPVIFSACYRQALLSLQEKEGGKTVVRAHAHHHHRVTMSTDHILRDIDTPEDYTNLATPR